HQRELGARAYGAFDARHRQLHRTGRAGSGARLRRLGRRRAQGVHIRPQRPRHLHPARRGSDWPSGRPGRHRDSLHTLRPQWADGRHWINSTTFYNRANCAGQLVNSAYIVEPVDLAPTGNTPAKIVDYFLDLLLQGDWPEYRETLLRLVGSPNSPQDRAFKTR